jgi:hypothetical protein
MKMPVREVFRRAWTSLPTSARVRLLPHILDGIPEAEKFRACLPTMEGLLRNAAANGFQPTTIIDIGANVGDWSRMASAVFPSPYILMVDGNPENEVHLRRTKLDLRCESD